MHLDRTSVAIDSVMVALATGELARIRRHCLAINGDSTVVDRNVAAGVFADLDVRVRTLVRCRLRACGDWQACEQRQDDQAEPRSNRRGIWFPARGGRSRRPRFPSSTSSAWFGPSRRRLAGAKRSRDISPFMNQWLTRSECLLLQPESFRISWASPDDRSVCLNDLDAASDLCRATLGSVELMPISDATVRRARQQGRQPAAEPS